MNTIKQKKIILSVLMLIGVLLMDYLGNIGMLSILIAIFMGWIAIAIQERDEKKETD